MYAFFRILLHLNARPRLFDETTNLRLINCNKMYFSVTKEKKQPMGKCQTFVAAEGYHIQCYSMHIIIMSTIVNSLKAITNDKSNGDRKKKSNDISVRRTGQVKCIHFRRQRNVCPLKSNTSGKFSRVTNIFQLLL